MLHPLSGPRNASHREGFEVAGIEEELEAYNPLIPDGTNWKATFMIEFGDPAVRAERLREMRGIENCINLEIEGHGICVIADEDLERETEEKTSAVHFMRFELSTDQIAALKDGAKLLQVLSTLPTRFRALRLLRQREMH